MYNQDVISEVSDAQKRQKDKRKKKAKDKRASKTRDIITQVRDGVEYLQAGTFEAIVNWLLDQVEPPIEESSKPDKETEEERIRAIEEEDKAEVELYVFIISYRQFMTPTGFFKILEERFKDCEDEASRYSVIKMLTVWIDKYLERDFFFRDKGNRLFDLLLGFLNEISSYDPTWRFQANKLKLFILRLRYHKHLLRTQSNSGSQTPRENTSASPRGNDSSSSSSSSEQRKRYSSSNFQDPSPTSSQQHVHTLSDSGGMTSGPRHLVRTPSRGTGLDTAMISARSSGGAGGVVGAGGGVGGGVGSGGSGVNGIPTPPLQKPMALCEMPLTELAEQLTLIELKMFKQIREREFLNLNWKRPDLKRNARHIVKMVERFNKVSYWVATRIVRESDLKRRCSILKRFIIMAERCAELNNFNTLMEVLAGLNLYPIQRLKQTWALLSDKYRATMAALEQLMENKQNYKNYRERLVKIRQNGEPTLPYLGVYLRDLTFIEEGNQTHLENDLINYEKIQLVGQVVREVQYFQEFSHYPDMKESEVPSTIKYLKKLRGLKQEELDRKSREAEPPVNGLSSADSLAE
jgi:hypothetical protein